MVQTISEPKLEEGLQLSDEISIPVYYDVVIPNVVEPSRNRIDSDDWTDEDMEEARTEFYKGYLLMVAFLVFGFLVLIIILVLLIFSPALDFKVKAVVIGIIAAVPVVIMCTSKICTIIWSYLERRREEKWQIADRKAAPESKPVWRLKSFCLFAVLM